MKHPWLQNAERLAVANRISFCWVPDHVGIPGNEEADRLGSFGLAGELTPEAVSIPSQDAIRWVK